MNRTMVAFAACVALCMAATPIFACTGMYAGRKVSADGTVLIGRTVDTPPWSCCFRAVRVPRGEGVKYAYVCTPAVTSVGKGFFPSACANEAGLVISGTVTGRTRPEILARWPKALAEAVAKDDASAVTDFARREQARAFDDAQAHHLVRLQRQAS